jgi:hypothetical protein
MKENIRKVTAHTVKVKAAMQNNATLRKATITYSIKVSISLYLTKNSVNNCHQNGVEREHIDKEHVL